jgi:hypothetical protein
MPITTRYVLVCDEVRQENNGKFLIVGLYTPDMTVPQIPFVLPSLTFFLCLESERPAQYQFRLNLQHLESGHVVAQGMGAIGFQRPGVGTFPVRMNNVQLMGAGAYTFSLHIEGEREPITTSFSVILNIALQPQPGTPAPPMLGG